MKEQDIIKALDRIEQQASTMLIMLQIMLIKLKDIRDGINNK